MKIAVQSGEIKHDRERIYEALLDPSVLSRLLPGVEKFEEVGPDTYDVIVKLGVGAIRGNYTGRVELADQKPPESYRLKGEAKGGPGWAKGYALFTLVPGDEGGTILKVAADAQVGGAIAGVGQRMMEGVAKTMMREFFDALSRELEGTKQNNTALGFGWRVFVGMIRDFFKGGAKG